MFLDSVDAGLDPWYADLTTKNHKVRFKIDTGADVSVIPAQTYYAISKRDAQLADDVQPDPDKIKAIMSMKEPVNTGEIRSFLGRLNQLGRYILGLVKKDKPLRDLLSKKNVWDWDCAQQKAFEQLKTCLTSPPVPTLG